MKKDDGRGKIKFATTENTDKFYFKGTDAKIDDPSRFIGTMTPSIFRWLKMSHLYDIMDAVRTDIDNKNPIIVCEKDEYTAIGFLQAISESRMWKFDIRIGKLKPDEFTDMKFYFTDRMNKSGIDFRSVYIGGTTPGILQWQKMSHLYDIMDAVRADPNNNIPFVTYGHSECSALTFLQIADAFHIWTFDFGIVTK
jgi:hypothetical protein